MKVKINDVAEIKPEFAYSIFCGVIHCRKDGFEQTLHTEDFKSWRPHVLKDSREDSEPDNIIDASPITYHKDLEGIYYPAFINCLFPSGSNKDEFSDEIKSYSKKINDVLLVDEYKVPITYLDLYCFPQSLIIYCFKCDMSGFTIDQIIKLNYEIRETKLENLNFLSGTLSKLSCDGKLNRGNKLKLFSITESNIKYPNGYNSDHLLYDIATCSPVGTAIGSGQIPSLQPSAGYFKEILERHKISVFDNWSALGLFDSFALVYNGDIYKYNWESIYFRLLYIHSLFIKNYLVKISSEFQLGLNKVTTLENKFHEFNKHFNLKQISHNFLPQLIYEKIRIGFNIENELTEIKHAIDRDHRLREEKREKKVNVALFIVAMLTVFTAIKDGSEWITQVIHVEHGPVFNIVTILAFLIIYSVVFYLLVRKK
jgi:hypothetical protein